MNPSFKTETNVNVFGTINGNQIKVYNVNGSKHALTQKLKTNSKSISKDSKYEIYLERS